jgi:hypothetical protein
VAAALLAAALAPGFAIPASASTSPRIAYHSGPEVPDPHVFLIYWGSWWVTSSQASNQKAALSHLFSGIGGGNWGRIIDQYCQHSNYYDPGTTECPDLGSRTAKSGNPVLIGSYTDPSDPPEAPTDNQLADEAATAFQESTRAWSLGTSVIPLVLTPPGYYPRSDLNDGYCGHHGWSFYDSNAKFSGTTPDMQPFAWADVPVSASDPVNNSGAHWCNFGHGLTAGLTITAGHEFAEAVTDWMPTPNLRTEQVTKPCASSGGSCTWEILPAWSNRGNPDWPRQGSPPGEIGDPCRQPADIFKLTLSTGTFWMQKLWSNTARACVSHA